MSKSPRRIGCAALRIAPDALPTSARPTSRHACTQAQRFARLALPTLLTTDGRTATE